VTDQTNKALITQEKPDAPAEWGSREEVRALAERLRTMMPGNLNQTQALALAQYSAVLDANPFRGEIYAFDSRGKLVLAEGYKLLVRWARRQCNYSDRYEPVRDDGVPAGAIAFRCYILRDDAKDTLKMLVGAGADWRQAFDIAAQAAVGVVTKADMLNQKGQPIPPPKGWTWEQVAKKRALKNALNLAYGAPSPKEIARESWFVEDIETIPNDWIVANGSRIECALTAKANAMNRQRQPGNVSAEQATVDLFDEGESPNDNGDEPTENLDLEALDWDDFHAAAIKAFGFSHKKHIVNALVKELGQGWGERHNKTELWATLEAHQAAKATQLELEK